MPIGYVDALPILTIKNGKLCMLLPFLKYKITGEIDKTLVYPIKFVISYSISDKKVMGFDDLEFKEFYRKIDFNAAIGFFRHNAIKHMSKKEYKTKRNELYSMYDKIIGAITEGEDYTENDEKAFKELLNIMIEPSLRPIYESLDSDFYEKYLV